MTNMDVAKIDGDYETFEAKNDTKSLFFACFWSFKAVFVFIFSMDSFYRAACLL